MKRFEDLCSALARELKVKNAVLDGEVVAIDESGMPAFYDLLRRKSQAAYFAFDILWLNGEDLRDLPLLESAFKAALRRAEALMVLASPLLDTHAPRIVELAIKTQLPTMFGQGTHVESGGLMYYGPNYAELHRRAATYIDRILKGANPGDLPVEQPTKFELVINLKTAKQIGLAIPPRVLARADKVIK